MCVFAEVYGGVGWGALAMCNVHAPIPPVVCVISSPVYHYRIIAVSTELRRAHQSASSAHRTPQPIRPTHTHTQTLLGHQTQPDIVHPEQPVPGIHCCFAPVVSDLFVISNGMMCVPADSAPSVVLLLPALVWHAGEKAGIRPSDRREPRIRPSIPDT